MPEPEFVTKTHTTCLSPLPCSESQLTLENVCTFYWCAKGTMPTASAVESAEAALWSLLTQRSSG